MDTVLEHLCNCRDRGWCPVDWHGVLDCGQRLGSHGCGSRDCQDWLCPSPKPSTPGSHKNDTHQNKSQRFSMMMWRHHTAGLWEPCCRSPTASEPHPSESIPADGGDGAQGHGASSCICSSQQCQPWATCTYLSLCCWVWDQGSPLGPVCAHSKEELSVKACTGDGTCK